MNQQPNWEDLYLAAIDDGNYELASEMLGDVDIQVHRSIEEHGHELDAAAEELQGLFDAADAIDC